MIKHLLEPPSKHGGIQFHRFNIESDSRLEGLIKMSDPFQLAPLSPDPLLPLSPDVYRTPHRLTVGARPDPVPPTQHQERLLTRGPHQDVGSGELLAFLPHHARATTTPAPPAPPPALLPLSLDAFFLFASSPVFLSSCGLSGVFVFYFFFVPSKCFDGFLKV
uniref:Uncharacterized protein n=1 Tax=Ananas comosus var. bracteatus TaxID=296719 RepID=A0A6V7NGV1_ANACO|nr:unnamed protein product [Ananas comosus var. bracteatus]